MTGRVVNILLVEDDLVDVMAFRRGLAEQRISNPIRVAGNGEEALAILRGEAVPPLVRPYLIVLDLNLPRMNGCEFLAELRADPQLRDSVVFVLTTSKDERDLSAAYRWNIAGYLVKADVGRHFVEALMMIEHFWRVVELP